MGNHQAGRAMGIAATIWWQSHHDATKDEAFAALDLICGPWKGCDAEFEAEDPNRPGFIHPDYTDYTSPDGPIGRLINIAFDATPEQIADYQDGGVLWLDQIYTQFRDRYDFT